MLLTGTRARKHARSSGPEYDVERTNLDRLDQRDEEAETVATGAADATDRLAARALDGLIAAFHTAAARPGCDGRSEPRVAGKLLRHR
jgi:hypothetical protein